MHMCCVQNVYAQCMHKRPLLFELMEEEEEEEARTSTRFTSLHALFDSAPIECVILQLNGTSNVCVCLYYANEILFDSKEK